MNNTALITGASGGIGAGFADIYASTGYNLLLIARSGDKLSTLKTELECQYGVDVHILPLDLSEGGASEIVFEYALRNNLAVDVLVNNAGFGYCSDFASSDLSRQQALAQVNMVVPMELTWFFLPDMVSRRSGHILNVASVASFCAGPKMSMYYASKAFLRSFSEAVAEEVCDKNVNVLAICPGPVSTGFEDASDLQNSKMFKIFKSKTAREVAEAGYIASLKGKKLLYYGASVKVINLASKLAPRVVTRKIAEKVNS